MSANPFLRHIDDYHRDINVRKGYVQQVAKYLSLCLKRPLGECFDFVMKEVKGNPDFRIKDPVMEQLIRKAKGHRIADETTFFKYIDAVRETGRIMSASMVVYERPEVEKSVTAAWLDENIDARKRAKKKMFTYKQQGDLTKSQLADYDQNARKIRINSVSGMRGFEGNPLFLATGHSSLTSLCRAAAGYGNATVERFLMGSKHYHTPEVAKANLIAVIMSEQKRPWEEIVAKYKLTIPTVDDVMDMVTYSTELYWTIPHETAAIRVMVEGMTDVERAIVCYSGDMYHLAKHNPEIVREILTELAGIVIIDGDVNTDKELESLDPTDNAYINALCASTLMGTTREKVKEEDPAGWQRIGRTAVTFKRAMAKYFDFINLVFTPTHLPPTVASLKSVQRRTSLTADTDSAIFTTEYWIQWFTGEMKRSDIADRIWYLTTYMACQGIANALAMLSTNVGVEKSQIFRLAMKNEYAFPVFSLTNLAKHYYSLMSMREGNVYDKDETEIKGVELRGSTVPKHILDGCEQLMKDILTAVNTGTPLDERELLTRVANSELETIRSIARGEYTYLRSANIKPGGNRMIYHDFWQTVMAPKYGNSVEPPYPVVKINTELVNKTSTQDWIDNIEDRALAKRLKDWMDANNKKDFPTMMVPTMAIRGIGLPIEIQEAANVRKLAFQVNSGYYRILESTGLFLVDRNHLRLVYDLLGLTP